MLDTEDLDLTSWAAAAMPRGQGQPWPAPGTGAGAAAAAQDGWALPAAPGCSVPQRCWWNGPCNHTSAAQPSLHSHLQRAHTSPGRAALHPFSPTQACV